MTTVKAFIFDLDGVLTDTAEYHYRAWKKLADEEGLAFTREDNEALRGVSRRESLLLLLKGRVLSEAQMEAWMARKNSYYREFIRTITPNDLLPCTRNFLNDAKQHGLKLGVASASKNAKDVMNGLQLTPLMEAVGDGYSVNNTKPAPDLFVWVAGRLGVSCSDAAVFEDAEAGIAAALNAGMKAIGLGPEKRVGKAHLVISGFEGVSVDNVLATLTSS